MVPNFEPALNSIRDKDGDAFLHYINGANEMLMRDANEEAAFYYRKGMPLRDPRVDGSAYVGLGAALHGSRRLVEARHVLVAGSKLNPASPSMLQNLATVLTDLGRAPRPRE